MDKEYVMHIAQTIKEQLLSFTPIPVFMSWGVSEFVATVFQELPALRLKVNGRLHAGYVVIALNGSDYYEVYLLKEDDSNAKCVNEEVCFDELGDVIVSSLFLAIRFRYSTFVLVYLICTAKVLIFV